MTCSPAWQKFSTWSTRAGSTSLRPTNTLRNRRSGSNKSCTAPWQHLRAQGRQIVGYGAPAKGNTLLSFLEIGPDTVQYIADRSPLKQGRYTPGSHIPVVSPDRLLTDQPEYVLLLAWNFVDEILQQQAEYRKRGGKFILPVPEVRII